MWLPHTGGHHKGFLEEMCTCFFAGLPSAMAAKLVKPDVAVMAIVGDGGFMMNSQVGGTPHVNTCQHCQACTVAACREAFMCVDLCMHVEGSVHMAHASSWDIPRSVSSPPRAAAERAQRAI